MKRFVIFSAALCGFLIFVGFLKPEEAFGDPNYWKTFLFFFACLVVSLVGYGVQRFIRSVRSSE